MCSYFQGTPLLSQVALLSSGPCGHHVPQTCFGYECPQAPSCYRPMPWSSETDFETWSQSGLDGFRGTMKGREHSDNFQEVFFLKRICQNSFAALTDKKREIIDFLQGPLSRLCSQGSPSSGPKMSPRAHFLSSWIQMDSLQRDVEFPCCIRAWHFMCNVSNSQNNLMGKVVQWC